MGQRGRSNLVKEVVVRRDEDLEQLPGLQQCATLTVFPDPASRMVCLNDLATIAAEQFRVLAVRLKSLRERRNLKKILITSSMPEEGKSVVAANLAASMAHDKKEQIVLIEGDLRRPTISQRLGCEYLGGLTEYLKGKLSLTDLVYRVDPQGFHFVPAGRAENDTFELLQSKNLPHFIEQLERVFDWVIIDSTPVFPLADTGIWAKLVDGIVLVARQGKTEKLPLQKTVATLDKSLLLGVVLNGFSDTMQQKYSKYYRYYRSAATRHNNNGHRTK